MDFTTFMYIGLGVFLVAIAVIGYFASKKTTTLEDFALAGRTFGPLLVAVIITSTYGSASSYLGVGGLAFQGGWPMMWIWVGCLWGIILPVLLLGPKMRVISSKLGAVTLPDYLGKRYNSSFLRAFAALGTIAFYTGNMVAQFKGVGVLIGTVLKIDFSVAVIVFGVVITLYCAAGGLFAVGWTDLFQGLFMALIVLILVPVSINASGGLVEMNARLQDIGPQMTKMFGNGYTPFLALLIVLFYCLLQMGQPNISARFFVLKNVKDFKKVVIYVLIGTVIMSSVCWGGFAARILYPDIAGDYAIPTMIMNHFPTIIALVAVLGIMAAMMTTIDGLLHCISTSIGIDIVRDTLKLNLPDKTVLLITRLSTIVAGAIAIVFTLYYTPEFLSLLVFGALGGVGAITVGPVIAGTLDKKVTKIGAITGAVVAEALFLVLIIATDLSIFQIGGPCLALNIVLTILVSRFAGKPDQEVNSLLFSDDKSVAG